MLHIVIGRQQQAQRCRHEHLTGPFWRVLEVGLLPAYLSWRKRHPHHPVRSGAGIRAHRAWWYAALAVTAVFFVMGACRCSVPCSPRQEVRHLVYLGLITEGQWAVLVLARSALIVQHAVSPDRDHLQRSAGTAQWALYLA